MKLRKIKTTTEIHIYDIGSDVQYIKTFINGVEDITKRHLKYIGGEYGVSVLYGFDRELLKTANPYWNSYNIPTIELPADPIDINLDLITLGQSLSHTFYTLERDYLPCVIKLDYLWSSNIKKIDVAANVLKNDSRCISLTVEDTPYYNVSTIGKKSINCLWLPTQADIDTNKHKFDTSYNLERYFISNLKYLGIKKYKK